MGHEKDTDTSGGIFDAFEDSNDLDEDVVQNITGPEGADTMLAHTIANPFEEGAGEDDKIEPGSREEGDGNPKTPPLDTTSEDVEEIPPFVPSKASINSILSRGPHKLNKQLILYVFVGILAVFVIFATFIAPLFSKKKPIKTKKPDVTTITAIDYSTLIPKKVPEKPFEEPEDDDEILQELPPIDSEYQYKPPVEEVALPVTTGGGGGSSRPDTKGDALQSKNISGIKGITSSQRQYLSSDTYQGGDPQITLQNPYAQYGMPTKDDYTAQMLSQYAQNAPAVSAGTSYTNQNDQSGKMNFYNAGRENAGNGVWLGPATVWQGTIFEAVLSSNINTDLPGEVTAIIAKNIYSSLDGKYLLIPQNSKLYGSYNSSISYSQNRVQVGWHTLIRPDGYAINLGNMAATDAQGAVGVKGIINDHPFQYLKAIALMSVFNIINSEFENSTSGTDNQYVQNIMANSQSVITTLGSKLIDRALDVQPTITIKAGLKINILVNSTLALPPLKPYDVTLPYHR
jgi:type IV secretion system protein VirB10